MKQKRFHETAKILLELEAEALKILNEENPQEMQNLVKNVVSKEMQFRIKAKEDSFNGEVRMRYSCIGASPVDYQTETRKMITVIEGLTN